MLGVPGVRGVLVAWTTSQRRRRKNVSFGSRSQPVMDYIAQATSAVSQKTDCKDLQSYHVNLGITMGI